MIYSVDWSHHHADLFFSAGSVRKERERERGLSFLVMGSIRMGCCLGGIVGWEAAAAQPKRSRVDFSTQLRFGAVRLLALLPWRRKFLWAPPTELYWYSIRETWPHRSSKM